MKTKKEYIPPYLELVEICDDVVRTSQPSIGGGDENELPVIPSLFD